MFTVERILVVTPGSLKTPLRGIEAIASPFKVMVGIVGSFVMTIRLVFVTTEPKPFCDVYNISYSCPSTVLSSISPDIVTEAPVSVVAPGSS